MDEKYVLDCGTADKLMMYVDRENDRIELIKEYYSPKSPEKVRIFKLSAFKEIARRILYSGGYHDIEKFYKDE